MFKVNLCLRKRTFFLTGSYTQTSNEGYEEFLKKLNVGFILRKAAMASTPVMTIAEVEIFLLFQLILQSVMLSTILP